jgi:hypothetical protein
MVNVHAPRDDFDASFQLGMHARCGTLDGFMSHTHLPQFRMALDGELITECHEFAWDRGLPLIGVTGDAALERELDGSLDGTPFLAVKHSTSRTATTPDSGGTEALHAFARQCALDWKECPSARPPERFTLEISLDPDLIQHLDPDAGLTCQSAAVVAVRGTDWRRDAQPAIKAAFSAALRPWIATLNGVAFTSEEVLLQQDARKLERFREYLSAWMSGEDEPWLE